MAAEEMVGLTNAHPSLKSWNTFWQRLAQKLLDLFGQHKRRTLSYPSFHSRRASASQQNIAWRRVRLRAHVGGLDINLSPYATS